ncbi:MAG: ATP-binding protein [bacterium]|nr:ATP-binding protein [bacterium]
MRFEDHARARQDDFLVERATHAMRFDIGSAATLVRDLVALAESQFHQRAAGSTPPAMTIVLRELLNNALVHGNQGVAALRIRGSVVHTGPDTWEIAVEDQGMGFDHRRVDMRLPEDPRRVRNRGLVLVAALSEGVAFNEKGNRVVVRLRIPGCWGASPFRSGVAGAARQQTPRRDDRTRGGSPEPGRKGRRTADERRGH